MSLPAKLVLSDGTALIRTRLRISRRDALGRPTQLELDYDQPNLGGRNSVPAFFPEDRLQPVPKADA